MNNSAPERRNCSRQHGLQYPVPVRIAFKNTGLTRMIMPASSAVGQNNCSRQWKRRRWGGVPAYDWHYRFPRGTCQEYRLGDNNPASPSLRLPIAWLSAAHSPGRLTVEQYPSIRGPRQEYRPGRWFPSKSLRELRPARALYQVDW